MSDERQSGFESDKNSGHVTVTPVGANVPPGAVPPNVPPNVPPGAAVPNVPPNVPPSAGRSNVPPRANVPPGAYAYGAYAYGSAGGGYPPPAYRPVPKKKMKPWKKALLIVSIVVGAILLIVAFIAIGIGGGQDAAALPGEDYIARISVVGEIGDYNDPYTSSADSYHHDWTMETIDRLIDDENNKGLLLYVDSPGGSVYESDEIYLKIMTYKAATERPVYVYMGSMAASGGYYISAPADKIYANRNTWTGSIGVIIGTLFDVSGFLEKNGIKATDITSGANKGMGGYFEPMTEEQRAIFQGLVDEAYEQFVGIIAEGRGMSEDSVKQIADGRILTAKQALEVNLIDEIALEGEAIESIKEEMGDPDLDVANLDFIEEPSISLFSSPFLKMFPIPAGLEGLLNDTNEAGDQVDAAVSGDVARVLELTQQGERVPIKYLYQG